MEAEDQESGVVKIGMFLSDYLSGVSNSKIYQLSRILHKHMSKEVKVRLDMPEAGFDSLTEKELSQFQEGLVDKNFKSVADLLAQKLQAPSKQKSVSKFSFDLGSEVSEDVFKTLNQDEDHEFLINDLVVVRKDDGRAVVGIVYLRIEGKIIIHMGNAIKSLNPKDIWYF